MAGLIQQSLPLVGVAVGAVGSYAFGRMAERARFTRDAQIRSEERRLQTYRDYGKALKLSISVAMRMAANNGNCSHANPLGHDEGSEMLAAAVDARETAWEDILLIGHSDVETAGSEWHHSVWRLRHFAKSRATDPDRWKELWDETQEMRRRYYRSAREDIGIDAGSVPSRRRARWGHPG